MNSKDKLKDKDKIQAVELEDNELADVTGGVFWGKKKSPVKNTVMDNSVNAQANDLLYTGTTPNPTNMVYKKSGGRNDDMMLV
ncbi:MAG: hypothetical protein MJ110_02440 [Lachnospiraceae bacterium]|nr:hypothetical protein [Lachnospiraceae bacterium]